MLCNINSALGLGNIEEAGSILGHKCAAPHLGKSTKANIPTGRPAAIVPTLGKQRAGFPNPAEWRRRPLPAKAAAARGRE